MMVPSDQRIDHEVHAVERPAGRASPERPPLRQIHVAIKGEKAGESSIGATSIGVMARLGSWWMFSPEEFLTGLLRFP